MTRAAAAAAIIICSLSGCGEPGADKSLQDSAVRIVTLAPHLAELVIAVGAGDRIVGVSAYTDYPEAARLLPVISDAFTVDQEQLALLKPDLVLAWESGTPRQVVDELQVAGYRVEVIRSRRLDDIPAALVELGMLTGRQTEAGRAAARFEEGLNELRDDFEALPAVRVFYQVSARPLYTIGGDHYISDIIALCGGHNIFADVDEPAPAVTVESVVDRDPETILGGSADGMAALDEWRRWPHLAVNRLNAYFLVDSDQIGRPSLRITAAAAAVCESLDTARRARPGPGRPSPASPDL